MDSSAPGGESMNPGIGLPAKPRAWVRVATTVLDRIASGELKPSERVPSKPSLARELGVSPDTVRRAFRELAERNVICYVPGIGYHVKPGATG